MCWRYRKIIVTWLIFIVSEFVAIYMVYCLNKMNYLAIRDKDLTYWQLHIEVVLICLIIVNGHGMVAFRLLPGFETKKIKFLHAIIQTLAVSGGLYACKDIYSYELQYRLEGVHLVLAAMTIFLVIIQWILGIFMFCMCTSQRTRKVYSGWHNFIGVSILIFTIATSVCMTQRLCIDKPVVNVFSGYKPRLNVSMMSYGVLISSIVLNRHLEWPLVGPL